MLSWMSVSRRSELSMCGGSSVFWLRRRRSCQRLSIRHLAECSHRTAAAADRRRVDGLGSRDSLPVGVGGRSTEGREGERRREYQLTDEALIQNQLHRIIYHYSSMNLNHSLLTWQPSDAVRRSSYCLMTPQWRSCWSLLTPSLLHTD